MRWPFLLLLVLGAAQAEVYRCEQNGRIVYTDQRCSESAAPKDLPKLSVVPPSEFEKRLAAEYDKKAAKDRRARDKSNREWLKQHKTGKAESERLEKARRAGTVASGMSADQVRDLYGEPDDIKKSERKGVAREVWTFHRNGGTQTVDLEQGRVVRHTEKKSKKK